MKKLLILTLLGIAVVWGAKQQSYQNNMGFSDVEVTDSSIYTIFHGISFKDIVKQRDRFLDGGKYIYVFSLEREPLCKYELDHYIYGIWVDEATKTIIATDMNNDQLLLGFNMVELSDS